MLGGGWISTAFEPAGRAALLALLATFLGVIALRGLVLWHIAYPLPATCEASDLPDDALPSYSILVAVYRETAVIEQLVRGLGELDYPADKLQILFVAEEHDAETQEAIRNAPLARHMHLVVVPEGGPRTKPRALGWRVGVLASATWEEAPPRFRDWRLQRVRWQKGWLQTALVHTRHPLRLWRELGTMKTVAVGITFASMLLSALVNPIYLAALAWSFYAPGVSDAGLWWWLGLGVFLSGYAVSLAVAAIAARRSGYANAGGVWSIPLYWLLISFAAYGALVEYWRWPFRWNKTPHTGRMAARASR